MPPTTDTADEQLERGVLGALLLAPDVEAAERLITALGEPANFDRPRVAEVWQIASQQWATTGRADIHSVIAALRANRRPIDPLWVLGCTDVDHTPATQQHALDWAVHVADKGRRRRVVEELTRALQQAENGVDGVGDTLARIERLQAVPGVTGTTWRPVDPAQLRDNPEPLPTPTILCRDDGTALLYPGRVNAIYGEPSGGKTWLALLAVKHQLDAGQGVLYVDFEDRAPAVYGRLELLGVDPDVLYDPARFGYCRIDETVTAPGAMNDLTAALDRLRPSLVVIDGVGESMSLEQLNPYDNPDVVTWWSRLPRHITRHSAEPAVLLIDHVVKDTQTRGSWAIGAQAKVASIDGAAYTLDGIPDQLGFASGERGAMQITIVKDRNGMVGAKKQTAATFIVDSSDGDLSAWLTTPQRGDVEPGERHARVVPTYLMEQVSRYVEAYPGNSVRSIVDAIRSKKENVKDATRRLVAAGYITVQPGPNRSQLHHSAAPYRQDDPLPRVL